MNPNEPLVLPPGTAPDDATAARIVACWNACQGISTEALNAGLIGRSVEFIENLSLSDIDSADFEIALLLVEEIRQSKV